jgi:hypothetical protein
VRVEVVYDPGVAENGHRFSAPGQGVFNHLIQVQQRALRLGLAGEVEQPLHDLPAAQRLIDDGLDVFPPWVIVGEILEHQAAVGEDARQGVVDLVRDPGGQLPDGHHLLGLDHLRLHALQFGGPLLDLPLELVGALLQCLVGELDLAGHRVEAVREVAQFVVAPTVNRLRVVALGDALGGEGHAVDGSRSAGDPHGLTSATPPAAMPEKDQQAPPRAVVNGRSSTPTYSIPTVAPEKSRIGA